MVAIVRLLFTHNTFLKQQPIQSSQLPDYQLQKIPVGTFLVLQSYGMASNNHIRLSLKDIEFKGVGQNWFAYSEHVSIWRDPFRPVETVDEKLAKQVEKNTVKISLPWRPFPTQSNLLKIVFNRDTIIKRVPVPSQFLSEASRQDIPAGTELVLLTERPDAQNQIQLPIEENHVKFTLQDIEFKGFSRDWYGYIKHVGIQPLG